MKRLAAFAVAGLVAVTACGDQTEGPSGPSSSNLLGGSNGSGSVTVSADAGSGSFRAAIDAANNDPRIRTIRFRRGLRAIALIQPVTFSGAQDLTIDGDGAVLDGSGLPAGAAALTTTGGGDLVLSQLTVRKAPGHGVVVAVPETAVGTVEVRLEGFAAVENGGHGVLINDQPDYFNDPNSTSEAGSPASVRVRVNACRFQGNGFADLDRDGLRINEGGEGTLDARIEWTSVTGNGGDGIELDERGAGDAQFKVEFTALNGNGSFSAEDFDDGIDVDESGDGNVVGSFLQVLANDNFEQGVDLNENGLGDMRISMLGVTALRNHQEGIEFEEDDDVAGGGDLVAFLELTITNQNGADDGDAGLKLREKGPGNLSGRVGDAISNRNQVAGILLREDAAGDMNIQLVRPQARENVDDGIQFDENGDGNMAGEVIRGASVNNTGAGIDAEQATAGTGLLKLRGVTVTGNAGGNVVANSGVTVETTP